jgi:hypothetical protein
MHLARLGSAFVGRAEVPTTINDGDIEMFLRRNAGEYPSQIGLIQAAVRLLWPNGPPSGGAERVVRVCLGQPHDGVLLAGAASMPVRQLPQPQLGEP